MGRSLQSILNAHRRLRAIFLISREKRSLWDRLTFELRAGALLTRMSKRYSAFIPVNCDIGQGTKFLHELDGIHVGGEVVIGSNCTLGHNVTIGRKIGSRDHRSAPVIGNEVFIGTGAIILGRCTIGDGAKIGAGVVLVDVDIPPGAIIVNNSAVDAGTGQSIYTHHKARIARPVA